MGNHGKKINIAIIIPRFSGGGAERTVSKLSFYLPGNRFEKYIVIFDAGEMKYEYEGHLVNLNLKASHSVPGKLIQLMKRIVKLKKVKQQFQIQISVSFLNNANIVNILSRVGDNIILSIRNDPTKSIQTFYRKIQNFLLKIFYKRADLLIAVSKGVQDHLIKNYQINPNKTRVISNFVDLAQIRDLSAQEIELELEDLFQQPVIISVGRLTKQKGQWHLIRAFKKVKEIFSELKLVFLGEGELESYLKELVHKLNLEKEVYFLGFQQNPFKLIARSKFIVLSSIYEGYPNVLIEAMACGIPVISTDCDSGPREILAPDTNFKIRTKTIEYAKYGILVPALSGYFLRAELPLTKEENLLAESMIALNASGELFIKYAKRSLIRAHDFEIKKNMVEYEKVFADILYESISKNEHH
ncbi:MAG: glycosyltransferase [Candidatus Atribacteria bacterium]|nr:glycosyltransferase [Candidatus Atribacteria bacterium]